MTTKSDNQIKFMRRAGKLVARILTLAEEVIKPEIATRNRNAAAGKLPLQQDIIPAFKGSYGFPAALSVVKKAVKCIPEDVSWMRAISPVAESSLISAGVNPEWLAMI